MTPREAIERGCRDCDSAAFEFGQDNQERLLQLPEPVEDGLDELHAVALIVHQVRGLDRTQDAQHAFGCSEVTDAFELVNGLAELFLARMRAADQIGTSCRMLSQEGLDELSLQDCVAEGQSVEVLRG